MSEDMCYIFKILIVFYYICKFLTQIKAFCISISKKKRKLHLNVWTLISSIYWMNSFLIFWISSNQDVRFLPSTWNYSWSILSVCQYYAWLAPWWYMAARQKLDLENRGYFLLMVSNFLVTFQSVLSSSLTL